MELLARKRKFAIAPGTTGTRPLEQPSWKFVVVDYYKIVCHHLMASEFDDVIRTPVLTIGYGKQATEWPSSMPTLATF